MPSRTPITPTQRTTTIPGPQGINPPTDHFASILAQALARKQQMIDGTFKKPTTTPPPSTAPPPPPQNTRRSVNLVRYISQSTANTITPTTGTNKVMIDGREYLVADIDYTIDPYSKPVTPESYLSQTKGVGSNIAGFLDVDSIARSIDVPGTNADKIPIIESSVLDRRTSAIFIVDHQEIDVHQRIVRGSLSGGVAYTNVQTIDDTVPIPVPDGLIRTELGMLMKSTDASRDTTNPFEVNFITPIPIIVKAKLYKSITQPGWTLTQQIDKIFKKL